MTDPASLKVQTIGHRSFCDEDQQSFAFLSSDCNPMHVSPIAARRLMAGRQVVHGIHLLVTAIEHWRNEEGLVPVFIACSFSNPVSVGDNVVFTQLDRPDNAFIIEASVNDLLCSKISIGAAPSSRQGFASGVQPYRSASNEHVVVDALGSPLEAPPESHVGKSYLIKPRQEDLAGRFPRSCSYLGNHRVAALLALSYFVGMVCPGLHSIFSSLTLSPVAAGEDDRFLVITVEKYDERFGLFDCSVSGCIQGNFKAFLRPPPQQQPTLSEIARRVAPGEFKGTRSLVIGGSRGLGETTAKILAAGGGKVIVTYASGFTEAKTICDEIGASGVGTCECVRLDLMTDSLEATNIDVNSLDGVFFFATPRIARKKAALFDRQLFHEFCEYYLEKFYDLCVHLEAHSKTRRTRIYFPSSVFVAERPSGMAEYAMAKAAAEVLIEDINRYSRNVSVLATRLPRLSTDQTSSLLKLPTADNVETLLAIVRSLNGTVRTDR